MLQRMEHTQKEPGANPEPLCAAPEGVWTPGFGDLEVPCWDHTQGSGVNQGHPKSPSFGTTWI